MSDVEGATFKAGPEAGAQVFVCATLREEVVWGLVRFPASLTHRGGVLVDAVHVSVQGDVP